MKTMNFIQKQINLKLTFTDEEVKKVCKVVGLDHFIKTLPHGYNSSIKETNSHPNKLVSKDSSIRILNKESMKEESKVENIDEDNFKEKNKNKKDILKIKNEEERQSTVEIKDENDDMEYYIFILDNNGNMNMYKNKKNITLFNLYNVNGIDESYKEKKFSAAKKILRAEN